MRVIAGVALAAALSGTVYAAPPRAWSPETRLTLARCLIAEADGHTADYLPILGVLERRAELTGRTIEAQARAYCGFFRLRSKRAENIRASTFAEPRHGNRKLWIRALVFVEAFERGELRDVCRADHWAEPQRRVGKHLREIYCAGTANRFYVEGRTPASSTPRPADAPDPTSWGTNARDAGRAVGVAR